MYTFTTLIVAARIDPACVHGSIRPQRSSAPTNSRSCMVPGHQVDPGACWECTVATDVAAAVTSAWFFASLMTRRSLRHHPVFLASRIHISGAA